MVLLSLPVPGRAAPFFRGGFVGTPFLFPGSPFGPPVVFYSPYQYGIYPYGYGPYYGGGPLVQSRVVVNAVPEYAPPQRVTRSYNGGTPQPQIEEFPSASRPGPGREKAEAAPARIEVRAPAGAEISFDGVKTKQKGTARQFVSPPLPPGRRFAYQVRASWREDGREVVQTRRVTVRAGEQVSIDFTPPGKEEELPQPKPAGP
jgi:uncharacterized protein (TIGR03000 family)